MIATVMYASLDAFYKAERGEIDPAVERAWEEANRLVRRLPPGVDEDAFSERAGIAVWRAALAYRPERGVPFAAWAAARVDLALRMEQREQDWVPERRRRSLNAGEAEAGAADLRPESLEAWSEHAGDASPPWEEDRRPGPEALVLAREGMAYILQQMHGLPPRDRDVLLLRYEEGWRLAEIGKHLGVTTSRAGQLVRAALLQLRDAIIAAGASPVDF